MAQLRNFGSFTHHVAFIILGGLVGGVDHGVSAAVNSAVLDPPNPSPVPPPGPVQNRRGHNTLTLHTLHGPKTALSAHLGTEPTSYTSQSQIKQHNPSTPKRAHAAYSPKSSRSFQWSQTGTIVFAAFIPDAATAGSPMPGNVVSPHA